MENERPLTNLTPSRMQLLMLKEPIKISRTHTAIRKVWYSDKSFWHLRVALKRALKRGDERRANNEITEFKAIFFRNGIGIICGAEPYLN
jgi:hypothetical protein